jgi:aminopeptidase N
MKKILLFLAVFISGHAFSQQHVCAKSKQHAVSAQFDQLATIAALSPQISHELKYDVKFVHLDLTIERTNKFISGNVKTVAKVVSSALDTFQTILHQNHTVDSIRFNGVLVSHLVQDSMIKVKVPSTLTSGASFTSVVYYHGTAPNGGSAIGSGFSSGQGWWGNRATWSLSESFVAYHWWPCKQILTDKIDSSWVFITTDSTNKAGSNGVLENVVTVGSKKRYEWKSRAPIAYYLISVAVAQYTEYNLYAKPQYLGGDSILIQNYIFDTAFVDPSWQNSEKIDLDNFPPVLSFLCNMYGMYPFYKEKYGHCMSYIGGAMEHQTMTSTGFFEYYINAHELGHQWWGDQVTCKSWGDIWINEGFASYTEHLVAQYLDPPNFAPNLNAAHNSVMGQPGGSIHFTDTMNTTRIFSSRLTYDKGGAIIHSLRFLTNNDSLWFNTLRGFQNTYKNSTASTVDFINYYQAQTGINPTQFFSQWYYGEGYPTFSIRYNYFNDTCIIKSTQSVSMPSVTPLFITPLEYKIARVGKPDTVIRVMHSNTVEIYTLSLTGTVTSVICDPKNWIINKVSGSIRDVNLGIANPVGIVETGIRGGFNISPNPATEMVKITNNEGLCGKAGLYDLNGKLIAEKDLVRETQFNLQNYPSGIYLVRITDHQGKLTHCEKVIKQ